MSAMLYHKYLVSMPCQARESMRFATSIEYYIQHSHSVLNVTNIAIFLGSSSKGAT